MPATNYANNGLLSYEFLKTGINPVTHIGLSTSLIDDNGGGAAEPESGTGYARQSISAWTYPEDGKAYNNAKTTFPVCSDSWGTIVEVFLSDAQTGGNILYHTKLSPTIPTYIGTQLIFNPQTFIVTERA